VQLAKVSTVTLVNTEMPFKYKVIASKFQIVGIRQIAVLGLHDRDQLISLRVPCA
jgi:hypothetical protein